MKLEFKHEDFFGPTLTFTTEGTINEFDVSDEHGNWFVIKRINGTLYDYTLEVYLGDYVGSYNQCYLTAKKIEEINDVMYSIITYMSTKEFVCNVMKIEKTLLGAYWMEREEA